MSAYLGDFAEDAALHFQWSTNDADGASITRSTDGEVRVYKDNGVGQSTAGVTDTEDFDGLTGVHACTIDLSADAFYAVGANYTVVLSAATIDAQTVNAVLAHFSIENRYTLLTAARAQVLDDWINAGRLDLILDIIAGDVAGLDGDAMVGTDGANTTVPDAAGVAPTAAEIQAEMEENGASILDSINDLLPGSTIAAATDIPAMRGTDSAALASVVTETRMSELDAATGGKMANQVDEIRNDTEDIQGRLPAALVSGAMDSDVSAMQAGVVTAAVVATDAIDADALAADASVQTAAAVWDRVLSAATHNISTSAGRRLRDLASVVIITGTAEAVGNTSTRIVLNGDASAVDGAYDPAVVTIVAGTGAGQSRQIWEYDGTNKYAYVNRDWKVTPDGSSEYVISANSGDTHVNEGVAGGGGPTSITLNTLASSVSDTYIGQIIFIVGGTGADQARRVTAYNGGTQVATVRAWETQPDATSIYAMLPETLIKAQIIEALDTDTYAEPGQGAPAATATIVAKLGLIYKWLRNKKDNDGTTVQLYNDAGAVVDQKRTVSEAAGTVTEAEMETGP